MDCDRCGEWIKAGEERRLHGQTLCEECCFDLLSPAKACDPWAVHSAKSFAQGTRNAVALTDLQSRILQLLAESGGVEPEALAGRLGLKPSELEREFATLRHMEKARAELRDGKKFLCLW